METLDTFKTMSRYNQWMNERLYELCASMPDEVRKEDRGAFFKSVHGILNHLLLADRLWLGRFKAQTFQIEGLDQELYSNFEELRSEREKTDIEIEEWVDSLTEEQMAAPFSVTSVVRPQPRVFPFWVLLLHMFNHQTHHRGQLTTLLDQLGCDYEATDLLWLSGLEL